MTSTNFRTSFVSSADATHRWRHTYPLFTSSVINTPLPYVFATGQAKTHIGHRRDKRGHICPTCSRTHVVIQRSDTVSSLHPRQRRPVCRVKVRLTHSCEQARLGHQTDSFKLQYADHRWSVEYNVANRMKASTFGHTHRWCGLQHSELDVASQLEPWRPYTWMNQPYKCHVKWCEWAQEAHIWPGNVRARCLKINLALLSRRSMHPV